MKTCVVHMFGCLDILTMDSPSTRTMTIEIRSGYDEYVMFSHIPNSNDDSMDVIYHCTTRVVKRFPQHSVPPLPCRIDGNELMRNMSFKKKFMLWMDRITKGKKKEDYIFPNCPPPNTEPYHSED